MSLLPMLKPLPEPALKSISCEISEEMSRSLCGTLPSDFFLSVNVAVRQLTSGPRATLVITVSKPTTTLTERQKTAALQLATIFSGSIQTAVKHVLLEEKSPLPASLAGEYQEK